MSVSCEVCGGTEHAPVLVGHDRQHGVEGEWELVRCAGCGLVRIDPLPEAEEIGGLYPGAEYYAHRASAATFREMRVSALKRFVLRHRYGYPPQSGKSAVRWLAAALAAPFVSKRHVLPWVGDGQLLDVGCGVGSELWRLRAFGWHVRGLEIDDAAASIGREQGLDITTGTLENTNFPDASFDVVRLSHVLEHVRSPLTVLHTVRRILKPHGRLWMAMPNVVSWGFERFGGCWFPLELPRHLYQFSPTTLRTLCANAGLQVLQIRCCTPPELFLRSMDYEREERGRARGKPLRRHRWLKRVIKPWVRRLDRGMRGDIMECWCAPAAPTDTVAGDGTPRRELRTVP